MIDWFWIILKWSAATLALLPMIIGIGCGIYEGSIRPRLIPQDKIEAMTDDVMRDHAEDPVGWAFMEEYAAWLRGHTFKQGQRRRIRRSIQKRLLADNQSRVRIIRPGASSSSVFGQSRH